MPTEKKRMAEDQSSLIILITRIKNKDEEAIMLLYDKYAASVFTFIHKILPTPRIAEKALQNTFVKACSEINGFDETKEDFEVWLMNRARNEAIDTLINVQSKHIALVNNFMCANTFSVHKFLHILDPFEKTIFSLVYFARLDYPEISKLLQIPHELITARIHGAYAKLQSLYPANPAGEMRGTKMPVEAMSA